MAIPAALARRRDYAGPAIFSYGFRPFFTGGAVWAALAIILWIPLYTGDLTLPSAISPLHWHVHEMLYGYVAAVIAGFLLTAIPNWTGRLPVCGAPLAALAALWLAGRIAMLSTATIGLVPAAVIDVAFLASLATVAMREIIAGKNWRNLRVLAIVALLILGNVVFHIETIWYGAADYGIRLGLAAVMLLISLVGGRIIPSFTRNWLVRENPGRLPQPFGRLDMVTIAFSAVALAAWVIMHEHAVAGGLLLIAGALHIVRFVRWAGDRTLADRLVLVLHVAYAFVPTGFILIGASILWPAVLPASAGIHAWTAGAIGMMTMAVMTRASLGHTGQALAASPATQVIYALVFIAAVTRITAAFTGDMVFMHISATAWVLAFGGFAAVYGPRLIGRPPVWLRRS
ncbi:MAG: NnrS family protein [Pseudorhodoplanes sp.]|jgi:uncharacterized protein involved in response to NO|nr:NnrS family protein [Pseudorhodoplanes sp.]